MNEKYFLGAKAREKTIERAFEISYANLDSLNMKFEAMVDYVFGKITEKTNQGLFSFALTLPQHMNATEKQAFFSAMNQLGYSLTIASGNDRLVNVSW